MKSMKSTLMALATFCAMATASLASGAAAMRSNDVDDLNGKPGVYRSESAQNQDHRSLPKLNKHQLKTLKESLEIKPSQERSWGRFAFEMNSRRFDSKISAPKNLHALPVADRMEALKSIQDARSAEIARIQESIVGLYADLNDDQRSRFDDIARMRS